MENPGHLNAEVNHEVMTVELRNMIWEQMRKNKEIHVRPTKDDMVVEYKKISSKLDSNGRYVDLRPATSVGSILVGPLPCVGIKSAPFKGEALGKKVGDNIVTDDGAEIDLLKIPVTYRNTVWTSLVSHWPKDSRHLFTKRAKAFRRGIHKWLSSDEDNCSHAWKLIGLKTGTLSTNDADNVDQIYQLVQSQSTKHFKSVYINKDKKKTEGILGLRCKTAWNTNEPSGGMRICCEIKQIMVDEATQSRKILTSNERNLLNQYFVAFLEIDDSTWRITKDFCGQRLLLNSIFYMVKPRYSHVDDMEFFLDKTSGKLQSTLPPPSPPPLLPPPSSPAAEEEEEEEQEHKQQQRKRKHDEKTNKPSTSGTVDMTSRYSSSKYCKMNQYTPAKLPSQPAAPAKPPRSSGIIQNPRSSVARKLNFDDCVDNPDNTNEDNSPQPSPESPDNRVEEIESEPEDAQRLTQYAIETFDEDQSESDDYSDECQDEK